MALLAHERATVTFERVARKAFGKDVCGLLVPRNLVQFNVLGGSELAYPIDASVDVLGALIHPGSFYQVNGSIVVLCDEGWS